MIGANYICMQYVHGWQGGVDDEQKLGHICCDSYEKFWAKV